MNVFPYKLLDRWEEEDRQKEIDRDLNWVLSDGKLMFKPLPKQKVKKIKLNRDKDGKFIGVEVE
ncbi:MAG: hypothetical protein QN834_08375 [Nitrososphaeraceae archaeon]|nr:hypothetical protein [Nitrososphaeraceae archaeon]